MMLAAVDSRGPYLQPRTDRNNVINSCSTQWLLVTTSEAPVTASVALVSTSFLLLLVRHRHPLYTVVVFVSRKDTKNVEKETRSQRSVHRTTCGDSSVERRDANEFIGVLLSCLTRFPELCLASFRFKLHFSFEGDSRPSLSAREAGRRLQSKVAFV